jgi:hypothetical protein
MTAEVTLYRCYWPPVHAYLKGQGAGFVSQAFDLLMTLRVDPAHAAPLLECLPAGVVLGVELLTPYGNPVSDLSLELPNEAVAESKN